MSETNKDVPFKVLGVQLKKLREKRQESLAEVSGAVEIEPDELHAIEQGVQRPGEDILLLLISHFGTKDETATKLWKLAGYDQGELPMREMANSENQQVHNGTITMAQNAPVVYTDVVHVMVNNYGVVMNFMQTAGTNVEPQAIARVGMSREHAQSVLEILQKTLRLSDQQTQTNQLPPASEK